MQSADLIFLVLGGYEAMKGDDTGPASKTIGPYESNVANVLDPRVKPEPEKMKENEPVASGQYKPDTANTADPRVTSDSEKAVQDEPTQEQPPQDDTHYGRDAAVAGGVGAAGLGTYEATKGRSNENPSQEDTRVSTDSQGHHHLHKKGTEQPGEKKPSLMTRILHPHRHKHEAEPGGTSTSTSTQATSGAALGTGAVGAGAVGVSTLGQQGSDDVADPSAYDRSKDGTVDPNAYDRSKKGTIDPNAYDRSKEGTVDPNAQDTSGAIDQSASGTQDRSRTVDAPSAEKPANPLGLPVNDQGYVTLVNEGASPDAPHMTITDK